MLSMLYKRHWLCKWTSYVVIGPLAIAIAHVLSHNISIAFSEDGLSAIATKLGTPLMPDSYKADMCMQSWGRSSYARAMIELRANVELKDNIMAAMPKITRDGYCTCNIRVEDSYLDNDDYDPYNDDTYENHDMSEHLQSICDDLNITVCGGKKK
uniref:Uncharacterized protein n=1 Tax=Tanacetum cinerariifolium TaxID=118510 RepID=A0A6L2P7D5_TANCI|nr:hypothetical protein [Tanacetum cinerariifolium]